MSDIKHPVTVQLVEEEEPGLYLTTSLGAARLTALAVIEIVSRSAAELELRCRHTGKESHTFVLDLSAAIEEARDRSLARWSA